MDAPAPQPTFTVDGNRLTLLDTGPRRLDALLALIDGARHDLRILYYIYADDETGRRVNAALIAAAGRGVSAALVVDGFGSETDEAFYAPLREAGVSVCRFSPRFGRRYLLRNHQKLALADAQSATPRIIVGGFNVEDDYFGTPADAAWRDLGLLVEGPAAGRLAGYFDALHDWVMQPKGKLRRLNAALSRWSESKGTTRWLIGGPTRRLSPWARTVRDDMRRGKRIDIIAAYFTPSPTILRRLDKAGRRRARVRVVTAAKSDNNATIAAARFTYAGLLRKGVQLFEYQPTKLHTKLYVIDDAVHVGSANFDMRSLFINLELMFRVEDRAFADHVRGYVEGEIARSQPITRAWYREHTGAVQRVRQFFAYLMIAVVDPGLSRGLNFGIDE
ncbi:phosphatidylserine/phosphatidylglycerophosphate/cardiolipin synthase family protein [Sphingomonas sp. A2-49]|uniref:phospholipase D-like domain-containing protein n=1 Tax=Sphingomonas sp. A2-49 TaxID=1391375 RepID=UPI0021D12208|nr:phosphatidylserine/phosphatidylglycerophosphate/cardiolipin synthase family protein [Sphingomonas sp. A2-49]MCU6455091.1 phosphatidylserine/phosphatidylglycerophosphate/cardiolipin synthase family protein [Sphingomonas sp. A2-49]